MNYDETSITTLQSFNKEELTNILKDAPPKFLVAAFNHYSQWRYLEDYKDREWDSEYINKCNEIKYICTTVLEDNDIEYRITQESPFGVIALWQYVNDNIKKVR